jgi:hypothetical protein
VGFSNVKQSDLQTWTNSGDILRNKACKKCTLLYVVRRESPQQNLQKMYIVICHSGESLYNKTCKKWTLLYVIQERVSTTQPAKTVHCYMSFRRESPQQNLQKVYIVVCHSGESLHNKTCKKLTLYMSCNAFSSDNHNVRLTSVLSIFIYRTLQTFPCIQYELKMKTLHQRIFDVSSPIHIGPRSFEIVR